VYILWVEQYSSLVLYSSDLSCQHKALVSSGGYHVIITTNIHWSELPNYLKGCIGKYTEVVSVSARKKCWGGQSMRFLSMFLVY
jgi:hypothetical protein